MERLGKYEIISEIGRGAMGAVYKARDPLIGRLVALKTITTGLSPQSNSLERFYQEARSAGALQHPNIITIFELGQEKNTPFIAMEYIEGGSLEQFIAQREPLPLSVKLGYMVRVCEALSYAHRHSVIHRDIKPGNIMVTKDGVVKVVDFGIARLTDLSLTQPHMMIGSRAYMSPQMYKGERADARADIWAVGVTLYELLAYQRPFEGDSEAGLMYQIINNSPPLLQSLGVECSDELAHAIRVMLEKKLEDRYQSMEDVLRDLEPIWKTAQQSTVTSLLADSQTLVAANDLPRAQALLRKALQIDTTNTQVKSLLDKVTANLRRSQILPKLNEHLDRARNFLQTGKLREARNEAEAALGLDSRHEDARLLFSQVEAAADRAKEVEQKLRLTKQRLAEGAVTEAAAALDFARQLDSANPQVQELMRQIEEERNRRGKRKKLSEVLHRARTLWTALSYEECLSVISHALKEFPNEPELLKLQEMTVHDLEDLQKQRQLGEVRKLLGQQDFAEARKRIEELTKKHPKDSAVRSLHTIVLDNEREQQKSMRFTGEIAALRTLLSSGMISEALAKGELLLHEYPEEFELKELVDYAREEIAQRGQRQKEKDLEKQIHSLLESESYREAEVVARRGAQEFPKQELFQRWAEEAGAKRQAQEKTERARQEMQRRIEEIHSKLNQDQIADAITLAERTLVNFGPDPSVTQLLEAATSKRAEHKKKQDQQIATAQTLIDARDFSGATLVLNQGIDTKVVEHSDPRVQRQLRTIQELSASVIAQLPAEDRPVPVKPAHGDPAADTRQIEPRAAVPVPAAKGKVFIEWCAEKWHGIRTQAMAILGKPAVLASAAGIVLLIVVIAVVAGRSRSPSEKEKVARNQAMQLWSDRKFDDSERAWKTLDQPHGFFQTEARRQIDEIEQKRQGENSRFAEGISLKDQKNYPAAAAAFQDVVKTNLWHVDDAQQELLLVRALEGKEDISAQERAHFDLGEKAYQSQDFENARKEFKLVEGLDVADSTLKPQAQNYLKKIRQAEDNKKLYESALADIKNEDWTSASERLRAVVDHGGTISGEAKKRLAEVTEAQKVVEAVHQSLQTGAYRNAKNQLNSMQWPITKAGLLRELQSAERLQEKSIENRGRSLQASNDLAGLEHLQEELHSFQGRVEDPDLEKWARDFDKWLVDAQQKLREEQGDKVVFEAAVTDFNATRDKGELERMKNEVLPRFQKIAQGSGANRELARTYVSTTIPAAIRAMMKTQDGKVIVPPIVCAGGQTAAAVSPSLQGMPCAKLDADVALKWEGTPTVEFPGSANQPGKLPYTLPLIVTIEPNGKVKVEKDGNADKDFLKKAKEASKNWRATIPKSGGKPVSVSFPFSITFPK